MTGNRARWLLAALVGGFGVVAFGWTVRSGRADSALLFVGLPVLLAVLLVLVPGRTTHGRVFQATTVCLLLAAVALHEGAICVVLAAPLVYAVAHGATAFIRAIDRERRYVLLPIPLLLTATAVEGVTDDLRVRPEQAVTVSRVVALTPDGVAERLRGGPHPTEMRSLPLRLLRMPAPVAMAGTGLEPGDRWMFHYPGSAHGSGGHTVTEVVSVAPAQVAFDVVEDSAITTRWLEWRRSVVRWEPVDAGHTRVSITLAYGRRLDPSWYFGPVQQVLMREGAGYLLDALALR